MKANQQPESEVKDTVVDLSDAFDYKKEAVVAAEVLIAFRNKLVNELGGNELQVFSEMFFSAYLKEVFDPEYEDDSDQPVILE